MLLFYKKHSKKILLILALIIGFAIIFLGSSGESNADIDSKESLDEYCERLEERVGKMCSSVKGVGKCKVIITLERGEQNSYKGSNLIETKPPRVLGVTVICEGADYDSVRLALTDMLTALFDIGTNRIAILKLN